MSSVEECYDSALHILECGLQPTAYSIQHVRTQNQIYCSELEKHLPGYSEESLENLY